MTPLVKRLIIVNAVVFVVTLAFGGLIPYLAFDPRAFIPRFWTIVTYMFVHGGFFHLLFNMLFLFFFGPPLEERWGSSEFLKFFLIAGLGGALLSLIFPYPMIGASGAVYGVMVAFAMYWPENPIYIWGIFPIKAKWLVSFLVGLSLFYAVTGGQAGVAHLAHLGGAIAAFGYLKSPWAPSAWGATTYGRDRSRNWKKTISSFVKPPSNPPEEATPISKKTRKREIHRSLDEVDRILDKISEGGIGSLTEEEKQRLEEASRRFRTN